MQDFVSLPQAFPPLCPPSSVLPAFLVGGGSGEEAGYQTPSTNEILSAEMQTPAYLLQPAIYLFCKQERSALVSESLNCGGGGLGMKTSVVWREGGGVFSGRGDERGPGQSSG